RAVEHSCSADDRREHRVAEAERLRIPRVGADAFGREPFGQLQPQIDGEKPADNAGEQIKAERGLGPEGGVGVRDFAVHRGQATGGAGGVRKGAGVLGEPGGWEECRRAGLSALRGDRWASVDGWNAGRFDLTSRQAMQTTIVYNPRRIQSR